jgi:hypothetical protein
VTLNLSIRESDYRIASIGEPLRACDVVVLSRSMALPIDLNHQPTLRAIEIRDETTDWMLPPEFESSEPTVSQATPEKLLGRCERSAQLASTVADGRRHVSCMVMSRRHSRDLEPRIRAV